MNIFNSLGSNYNFAYVYRSLLSFNGNLSNIKDKLEEKYGGEATFVYKGREALELALKNLKLPNGSFVAINGFTCFAVFEAINKAHLKAHYLDIAGGELNFSAESLEKALQENPKIKVVIVQNTLGYPSNIVGISKICKEGNLTLIEDLAHCVGTKYENGQEAGTVGDFIILSFSQDKIVDGISGGALINHKYTDAQFVDVPVSKQLIDKLYPLLSYLIRKSYPSVLGKILHRVLSNFGLLSKPLISSRGIAKLPSWYGQLISKSYDQLPDNLLHREKIASIYSQKINPKILSPKIKNMIHLSTNLRFPIFVMDRNNLIKFLKTHGVYVSDIWYDAPISPKKFLDKTDYQAGICPNSELAADEIVNLPTHTNVSESDAEKISQLINQWLSQ